jgi:hypothetical protein
MDDSEVIKSRLSNICASLDYICKNFFLGRANFYDEQLEAIKQAVHAVGSSLQSGPVTDYKITAGQQLRLIDQSVGGCQSALGRLEIYGFVGLIAVVAHVVRHW